MSNWHVGSSRGEGQPRILITRTDRIGDVVLSTPVVTALRKKFPNAYLAALCLPVTASILEGNPDLDDVIIYDKKGRQRRWWQSFLFAFSLRRLKFNTIINLYPSHRMHWLSFLAGSAMRVGYDKKSGFLLTHRLWDEKYKGLKHEAEYNFDLLSFLEIPSPEVLQPVFYLSESDKDRVKKKAAQAGLDLVKPAFALHVGASGPEKRWPLERFAAVAWHLIQEWGWQVVLVGGPETVSLSTQANTFLHGRAVDLTGKLSLKELGWLFKFVRFFLSSDTGPVHLAAAVETPVLSLFGRTDPGLSPRRWRPLGKNAFYLHKPPEEETGSQKYHHDQLCFDRLEVSDVVRFIEHHWREPFEGKDSRP